MTRARKPNEKFDARARRVYLQHYEKTAMKGLSAEAAGVHVQTVIVRRNADEKFAQQEAEAYERYCDRLEEEARRRGHDGYDEPVFQQGTKVGVKRKYSDSLLLAKLKRHRKEEYSDKSTTDLNVQGGVLVTPGKAVDEADWERRNRRPGDNDEGKD